MERKKINRRNTKQKRTIITKKEKLEERR